jgi:hypothetical protein
VLGLRLGVNMRVNRFPPSHTPTSNPNGRKETLAIHVAGHDGTKLNTRTCYIMLAWHNIPKSVTDVITRMAGGVNRKELLSKENQVFTQIK